MLDEKEFLKRSFVLAKFNTKMFETYCWETMVVILEQYPGCIPHATHQILVDSTQVMELKEAQKARSKDVKQFREFLKSSRQNTNRDVMRRLQVSSDPAISRIRKSSTKKRRDCLPEIEKNREFLLEQLYSRRFCFDISFINVI